MDSVTQVVLGAAVGEAVLGKKVGYRAMLWGAVAGTIPDLDVFLRFFTDEITATILHRGFSHSVVFSIIFAPIFGWIASRIHKKRPVSNKEWSWLFFWAFVTHPLLDAHTVWGTQLFWPLDYRLAYKSIFVVDPFYTIPFLICLLLALFHLPGSKRRKRWNNLGLILSSSYLLLSLVFKAYAQSAFKNALNEQNITYTELDTRPMPLNIVLWNAQIETKKGFQFAYYSLFDSQPITFSRVYPQQNFLIEPYKDQKLIRQLKEITQGWYTVEKGENKQHLIFTDLRFGQMGTDPNSSPFLFKYQLSIEEDSIVSAERLSRLPEDLSYEVVLNDLWNRVKGN